MTTQAIALSDDERNDLAGCEAVIERGLKTFREVGAALTEIRDARLYRGTHDTFEDYLAERWAMQRAQAYRLIEASAVVGALSPIGDTPLPATESQARELGRVPEEQRGEVWAAAVERNGGQPAPARLVAEVAAEASRSAAYACQACHAGHARWYGKCPACGAWNTVMAATEDDGGLMAHAMPELLDEPIPGPMERLVFEPKRDEDRTPIVRRPAPVEVAAKVVRDGDEWYTPARFIEAARTVLGGIDLDPASCEAANAIVQADRYLSTERGEDGLTATWDAVTVWLNPPYSNTEAWIEKLIAEYILAGVTEAVILVNAKTETAWFELLWEHAAVCFVRGRIAFVPGDGGESTAGRCGSAIAYIGPAYKADLFRDVFSEFGRVVPQGAAVTAAKEAVA